jgi:hypothetical protein
MPRPVVPIFWVEAASRAWSRSLVQRQDQAGVVGQDQQLGRDDDALLGDLVDLGEQVPRVDDDAVADDGELALHDTRRQQGQLVDLAVDHQRVAGVVAALEAHDDIGPVAEPVDDLALAFIAPLGADDGHIGHGRDMPCHLPGDVTRPFDRTRLRTFIQSWAAALSRTRARSQKA